MAHKYRIEAIQVPLWRYLGRPRWRGLFDRSLNRKVTVGYWYWIDDRELMLNFDGGVLDAYVPAPTDPKEREIYVQACINRLRGLRTLRHLWCRIAARQLKTRTSCRDYKTILYCL